MGKTVTAIKHERDTCLTYTRDTANPQTKKRCWFCCRV